jgi:hypothetical protein
VGAQHAYRCQVKPATASTAVKDRPLIIRDMHALPPGRTDVRISTSFRGLIEYRPPPRPFLKHPHSARSHRVHSHPPHGQRPAPPEPPTTATTKTSTRMLTDDQLRDAWQSFLKDQWPR